MPADKRTIGMGRRRQSTETDPERDDSRNAMLERAIDDETKLEARDELHGRGRQPGAHGVSTPYREIKPGTRSALEDKEA